MEEYYDLVDRVCEGNKRAHRIIQSLRDQYPNEAIGPKVLWLDHVGIRGNSLVSWYSEQGSLSKLNDRLNFMIKEQLIKDSEQERLAEIVEIWREVANGNKQTEMILNSAELFLSTDQFVEFLNDLKYNGLCGSVLLEAYENYRSEIRMVHSEINYEQRLFQAFKAYVCDLKQKTIRNLHLKEYKARLWKLSSDLCRDYGCNGQSDDASLKEARTKAAVAINDYFQNMGVSNNRAFLAMAILDENCDFIHHVFQQAVFKCNDQKFLSYLASLKEKFPLPPSFTEDADLSELGKQQLFIIKTMCMFYIFWCDMDSYSDLRVMIATLS